MAARKTIRVEDFVKKMNEKLAEDTMGVEYRLAVTHIVEQMLHDTGNYKGFGFLTQSEVPCGEKPGINANGPDAFINTDKTRRIYF